MPRYLLLMYNEDMEMPEKPTEEQMGKGTAPWREYLAPLTRDGAVESVAPVLWEGKSVTSTGAEDYKPQKLDLGGYMIIRADSMEGAVEMAKRSPHAQSNMGPTAIKGIRDMQDVTVEKS